MNTATTYRCYNPKCGQGNAPGWMLGANAICPKCGHWLTRQPNPAPALKNASTL